MTSEGMNIDEGLWVVPVTNGASLHNVVLGSEHEKTRKGFFASFSILAFG